MKKVVIIDYGSGNIKSVLNALEAVKENHEIIISNKSAEIKSADLLILPGVGAFSDCMKGLKAVSGLLEEIKQQVLIEKKPFVGICVGMQVLSSIGYEDGEHQGLDFIKGEVKKIIATEELKVPHMGWNELVVKAENHKILQGVKSGDHLYFANSYHFICEDKNQELAYAEYGSKICAIVAKDNIIGLQFHPEKSGETGLKILKNFLSL